MAIDFRCDYCGRQLSLADSLAGQSTTCPNCGVSLMVPGVDPGLASTALAPTLVQGGAPAASGPPPAAPADGRVPCPYCGERIAAQASKCSFCGEHLKLGQPSSLTSDAQAESAATLSLVLGLVGLLLCGLAAPFAIWQASVAKQRAQAVGVAVPGLATAGAILGWVVVALMAFGMLLVLGVVVLAALG